MDSTVGNRKLNVKFQEMGAEYPVYVAGGKKIGRPILEHSGRKLRYNHWRHGSNRAVSVMVDTGH